MLDPVNVSYVLTNEVVFCSLPDELKRKILGTVPDVLSKLNGLEGELVNQASLTKVSVIYAQICLEYDFMPLTDEAQVKMAKAIDTALEMLHESEAQTQDDGQGQDLSIPPQFGMKVAHAIDLPEPANEAEVDVPVQEETEDEDLQEYLAQIMTSVQDTILDIVKDRPLNQSVVELMYPSTRSQFEAGELTVGKLLQEQPSLIFVPVV